MVAFDRLHEAVGRPTGHEQSAPDTVDALMVVRGRRQRGNLRGREQPARVLDPDVVEGLRVEDRDAVLDHPRQVGQVGMQRSPERHVHDLHPATDAEGRYAQTVRRLEQLDLQLIAIGLDPVQAAVAGIAPISGRVDVAAAHEEEPIEGFEELLGGAVLAGGDDRGPGSGAAQALDVRAGDAVSAVGPAGDTIVPEVVRDDRDERAVGHDRSPRDLDEPPERLAAAALVTGHVEPDLFPHPPGGLAPRLLQILLGARFGDPHLGFHGVDLCVELGRPRRLADAVGLIRDRLTGGEERRVGGELERVLVPVEHRVAVRVVD